MNLGWHNLVHSTWHFKNKINNHKHLNNTLYAKSLLLQKLNVYQYIYSSQQLFGLDTIIITILQINQVIEPGFKLVQPPETRLNESTKITSHIKDGALNSQQSLSFMKRRTISINHIILRLIGFYEEAYSFTCLNCRKNIKSFWRKPSATRCFAHVHAVQIYMPIWTTYSYSHKRGFHQHFMCKN